MDGLSISDTKLIRNFPFQFFCDLLAIQCGAAAMTLGAHQTCSDMWIKGFTISHSPPNVFVVWWGILQTVFVRWGFLIVRRCRIFNSQGMSFGGGIYSLQCNSHSVRSSIYNKCCSVGFYICNWCDPPYMFGERECPVVYIVLHFVSVLFIAIYLDFFLLGYDNVKYFHFVLPSTY